MNTLLDSNIERIIALAQHLFKERDVPFVAKAYSLAKTHLNETELLEYVSKAEIAVTQIGLSGKALTSIFLLPTFEKGIINEDVISKEYGEKVAGIVTGLHKIRKIDTTKSSLHSENLIKLILTQADDVRVVLILLCFKMYDLQIITEISDKKRLELCAEFSSLYAPLAHRLGLYQIKTAMEEISMKYIHYDTYKTIAKKLAEKKKERDLYIKNFISPLKKLLKEKGIKCEIKGRPKSIYSIWNKIKKSNTDFEQIYDLFAIRIIIDSIPEDEKNDCWHVYSIISDIYRPNPKRLRDWISTPKNSKYESLHTTVLGPENKWVEVQIRTIRMDEVAEKGHAAHWRYKEGEKAVGSVSWLSHIRDILENPSPNGLEEDQNSRMELYTDEIFIFTPQGDLRKLRANATVLDFAYEIHSNIGNTCTAGKINGNVVPIKQQLKNGDKVEILTSKNQTPKRDWLSFVKTSKARGRIKKYLADIEYKDAEQGKEILFRKLQSIKVKFGDDNIHKILNQLKFKHANDLYLSIAQNKTDFSEIKKIFTESSDSTKKHTAVNAEEFEKKIGRLSEKETEDLLIIDENLSNVDYKFATCCNPIKGDNIFGFISANGGIKIHRLQCPNAANMLNKYHYRIIKAAWSKKGAKHNFAVGIRVIGSDEIGIVSNVTQFLSKDMKINIRSFNISSKDGNFEGFFSLYIYDTLNLDKLLERICTIKGVHFAERFDSYL